MLIFIEKPSWYEKNKQRLSEKRKRLYAEDSEYRKRKIEASRRHRRGERTPSVPVDAPVSLKEAAKRIGIGESTFRAWRRVAVNGQKLIPQPKHYKGRSWFTEKQVEALKPLKGFFKKHERASLEKFRLLLAELRASLLADWNAGMDHGEVQLPASVEKPDQEDDQPAIQ